jgi:hypothetical protein
VVVVSVSHPSTPWAAVPAGLVEPMSMMRLAIDGSLTSVIVTL